MKGPAVYIINPPSLDDLQANRDFMGGFGGTNVKGVTRVPALVPEYVAGTLRAAGIDAEMLDLAVEDPAPPLSGLMPGVRAVGLNCGTATFKADLAFADLVKKETGAFTFMFGPQATVTPEYAMQNSTLDAVIAGEPEGPALLVVRKLLAGDPYLAGIPGLWHRSGAAVVAALPAPPAQDIDLVPFPYRNLKYRNSYFYKKGLVPFISVLSSRGCPYSCIYCPYPVAQGSVFRGRSPENVISELLLERKRFDYKMILFRDPVFTFDRSRAMRLCALLAEKIKRPWWCETACLNADEELLCAMKKAGCRGINFGIETGSPDLISRYAKKTGGLDRIRNVFSICRRLGIATTAFFIVGLPGETKKTLGDTLKFALELDPDEINFTAATPFPGTELAKLLAGKGLISGTSFEECRVYECSSGVEGMTAAELQSALLGMYLSFYRRPARLLRELFRDPVLFVKKAMPMLGVLLRRKGKQPSRGENG